MKTLFRVKFGSHLYGTTTPESDTDYKSVHLPLGKDIIMQRVQPVISKSTGAQSIKNSADDIDDDSFTITKYFDMLTRGDMVAYELLFVKENQADIFTDSWYEHIYRQRNKLIDKNISGFVGYIRKQVNKYGVKGSRVATARAALDFFSDYYFKYDRVGDIGYDAIDEFVSKNDHCRLLLLPVVKDSNKLVDFLEVLNRKIDFRVSIKEAHKIVKNIFDEYGSRALAAESNQNVDWNAVYHAVRVSEQALELIKTGKITFPRENVDDLLKIRRGEYKFVDVAERLEDNLDLLDRNILENNILRDRVDTQYTDQVVEQLHLGQVKGHYG